VQKYSCSALQQWVHTDIGVERVCGKLETRNSCCYGLWRHLDNGQLMPAYFAVWEQQRKVQWIVGWVPIANSLQSPTSQVQYNVSFGYHTKRHVKWRPPYCTLDCYVFANRLPVLREMPIERRELLDFFKIHQLSGKFRRINSLDLRHCRLLPCSPYSSHP
jgi:hypothetical protein